MTAKLAWHCVAGFLVGVMATWVLGVATNTLLLPVVVLVVVSLVAWKQGLQAVAASVVCGSATVTLFLAWLFATLGGGLATM